ncbi:DUF6152 family protein [Candidatus Rariloculus sp.]|uniref:DUF6152 family protein n=1 Tax=Candidatus Rariloculus sp. TaxID=3101265 RepID=UPI003D13C04B
MWPKALSTVTGLMLTLAGLPVYGHHAFAVEFDVELPVSLTGTVTKVEMINPHSWIHIEVTDNSGDKTVWMIEGGSPNALYRQGITRNSVPVGAELTVNGYQARDQSNRAVGRDITFSDGRALFFSGTQVPEETE